MPAADRPTTLITVAICTWNRAHLLRQTLDQMTRLAPLPVGASWELIVVDNASTDGTVDVLESFMSRLPLRRVFEAKPGLSNARNEAIAQARGAHIVWTDDDVLVDSEWLAAYARAFIQYPDATFFGGPIAPWFDVPPPEWLTAVLPRVGPAFAIREFDARDEAINATFLPFGANMAFRTSALRATGFDSRLGRVGTGMLSGEELAVMRHLLARGDAGRWVPGAAVRHYIPSERQTIGYLRRFYGGCGETAMVLPTDEESQNRTLFGRPRWAWRAAIQNEIAYRVRRLTSRPEVWIEDLKLSSSAWGILRYTRVD